MLWETVTLCICKRFYTVCILYKMQRIFQKVRPFEVLWGQIDLAETTATTEVFHLLLRKALWNIETKSSVLYFYSISEWIFQSMAETATMSALTLFLMVLIFVGLHFFSVLETCIKGSPWLRLYEKIFLLYHLATSSPRPCLRSLLDLLQQNIDNSSGLTCLFNIFKHQSWLEWTMMDAFHGDHEKPEEPARAASLISNLSRIKVTPRYPIGVI